MEIKACAYHEDRNTISILTTDGIQMSLLCTTIEYSLHTDIVGHSKLVWLKDNESSTYAELVLKGALQDFLDQYTESYRRQQETIEKQLTGHFNGDRAYAAAIAREIMMYGG